MSTNAHKTLTWMK